jgi:hypothetical protein
MGQRKLYEAWKIGLCQPGPSLSKVRAPSGLSNAQLVAHYPGPLCNWRQTNVDNHATSEGMVVDVGRGPRDVVSMMLESVALTDLLHT